MKYKASEIEKIWESYIERANTGRDSDAAMIETGGALRELVRANVGDVDERTDIQDLADEYAIACEHFGFMTGFRAAMRLIGECFGGAAA